MKHKTIRQLKIGSKFKLNLDGPIYVRGVYNFYSHMFTYYSYFGSVLGFQCPGDTSVIVEFD